ncbi:MAG: hypothetical protein ACREV9_09920 [Burkholderiales bacterium]
MKRFLPILLLSLPASAADEGANDYPTADRVEYVLECLQSYPGKYEYIHKCSCAIDYIASKLSYDEYVEISTSARGQTMMGERGAEFRDPDGIRGEAKKFKALQADASKACFLNKPTAAK